MHMLLDCIRWAWSVASRYHICSVSVGRIWAHLFFSLFFPPNFSSPLFYSVNLFHIFQRERCRGPVSYFVGQALAGSRDYTFVPPYEMMNVALSFTHVFHDH
jgi:hypothetical protein